MQNSRCFYHFRKGGTRYPSKIVIFNLYLSEFWVWISFIFKRSQRAQAPHRHRTRYSYTQLTSVRQYVTGSEQWLASRLTDLWTDVIDYNKQILTGVVVFLTGCRRSGITVCTYLLTYLPTYPTMYWCHCGNSRSETRCSWMKTNSASAQTSHLSLI